MSARCILTATFVFLLALLQPLHSIEGEIPDDQGARPELRPTPALFPAFLRYTMMGIQAEQGDPSSLKRAYKLFRNGLQDGRLIEAVDLCRRLVAQDPDSKWTWKALWLVAEGYHRMRFYPEAASSWKRVLRLIPDKSLLLQAKAALAEALYLIGRWRHSMVLFQELRRSWTSKEEMAWVLSRIGDCLIGLGYKREASWYFNKALSLPASPDWYPPETYDHMAEYHMSIKDYDAVKRDLLQALTLYKGHPLYPKWLFFLGEVLDFQGKTLEAVAFWKRLLTLFPDTPQANWARVKLASLQVDPRIKAKVIIADNSGRAWLNPRHPIFWSQRRDTVLQGLFLELSSRLREEGKADQALRLLLNALDGFSVSELRVQFRKAIKETATSCIMDHFHEGNYKEVITVFNEAVKRFPDIWEKGEVLDKVAKAFELEGFDDLATEIYRVVQQVYPHRDHRDLGVILSKWRKKASAQPGSIETASIIDLIWDKDNRPAILDILRCWIPPRIESRQWGRLEALIRQVQEGTLSKESIIWLAQWWWEYGRVQESAQILKEAAIGWIPHRGSFDDDEKAWCLLGDSLRRSGRLEEALESYEKVLKRPKWGFLEKWASFQAIELARKLKREETAKRLTRRLLQQDDGRLFGNLLRLTGKGEHVGKGPEELSSS